MSFFSKNCRYFFWVVRVRELVRLKALCLSFHSQVFFWLHSISRKFFRNLWKKKSSAQNMRFCQNIPTPFWASITKNLNFFHFSRYTIWLVCHTVTIFLRTQRTMLIGPLRYLQRVRKAYRNFSGGTWKNVSAQNMRFCQNILTWPWASFFKISPFFAFPDI